MIFKGGFLGGLRHFQGNSYFDRKDRDDGYGGVFLACSDKYFSREITIKSECELVAATGELDQTT